MQLAVLMNETCLLLSEAAFQWVKASHPLPNPTMSTTMSTTESQNQDWLSMSENVKQAGPGTHYDNVTPLPQVLEPCGVTGVYKNVFTVTLSMSLMYTDTHTHNPVSRYKVLCALKPHNQ